MRIKNKENQFAKFSDEEFELGSLCKNNHDSGNTGKSLRYKRADGSLGNCIVCCRERKHTERLKRKTERYEQLYPQSGYKKCPKCNEVKRFDEFGKAKDRQFGISDYCQPCLRKYNLEQYYKTRDRKLELGKASRRKNWLTTIFTGSRSSAKARKLPFTITIDDLKNQWELQGGKCYWLGIDLGDPYLPNRHPLKPSIDRIDNNKGYEKGNFVFASCFANMGRGNCPEDEFREFLKLIDHFKLNTAYIKYRS